MTQQTAPVATDESLALEANGDMAAAASLTDQAIEFYSQAISHANMPKKQLFLKLGQEWMNAGRPFESLTVLRSALAGFPDDVDLRQRTVGLLSTLGLQLQAAEHLQWLIQRGHGDVAILTVASDLSRPQTVEATCQYALKHFPDDLRPQFSVACLTAYEGNWDKAAEQLKPVVERHPDFVPAHALYGRAIIELGDQTVIDQWAASLPEGIEKDPQYWIAAGIYAEQQLDPKRASEAFSVAVAINENDAEALGRWSATLAQIGRTDLSKAVAERAGKVAALRADVDSLMSWNGNSQQDAVQVARSLESLGRRWEATAWLRAAFAMDDHVEPDLKEIYGDFRSKLTGKTPWQLPESSVATPISFDDLTPFHWQPTAIEPAAEEAQHSTWNYRFLNESAQRKLDHVCKLGKPPGQESSLAIYQSGAGGAGVIDFDCNGWPDVYLTSSDGQPLQTNSSPNRLFQNLDGQFTDVTDLTGLGDRGFAQGIAVGDFNSDGFADVLVANIGPNRLYRNNGDGTFVDITDEAGLSGNTWTTSAAIVDIDGDAIADLFQVGYCADETPFHQDCIDEELHQPRSCSPLVFDAEPDRVWRGKGNGTFSDETDHWLGQHNPGRGLGLVVGALDQDPGLDIYVGNDMTANHYWSRDASDTKAFRMAEQASLRGLAVNERSLSQASMGIAVGDADSDGDIDFLLTHFTGEYNTFYEQTGPGLWSDRSKRVGFAEASTPLLGFGTQWIDVDNNGSLELMVANGDIDDFSHQNRPFRQPPQLFDRSTNGTWLDVDRETLGDYFMADHLARTVVTLDANRDGRTDLLVTQLFEPVALLINETPADFNQVRFMLRGTQCHRDAIGTQVEIVANGRVFKESLMAGDGYYGSNERCITFGLGKIATIDDITVHWPDGSTENIGPVVVNKDYLLVQKSGVAFPLERPAE